MSLEEVVEPRQRDNRNLIAAYKYWSDDAIRADLDSKRHPFSVLCLNIHQDLNLSTCLRGFNAFLGTTFILPVKDIGIDAVPLVFTITPGLSLLKATS